jgi:hypothetical protein
MLTFEFIVNPVILFIASVVAVLVGFSFSRYRLAKSQARIKELESEMMNSHSEILDLQKAYVKLQSEIKGGSSIPVIPMKISGKDGSNPKEKASK